MSFRKLSVFTCVKLHASVRIEAAVLLISATITFASASVAFFSVWADSHRQQHAIPSVNNSLLISYFFSISQSTHNLT